MALNEPAEPSEKAEQIDDDHQVVFEFEWFEKKPLVHFRYKKKHISMKQDDDSIPSPIKIEISSSQCSVVSDNEPMAKVPSSVAGSSVSIFLSIQLAKLTKFA